MSYILDALHKSERERQQQQETPDLQLAADKPGVSRPPGWVVLIPAVVILVAAAAFAGYRRSAPDNPAPPAAMPGQTVFETAQRAQNRGLDQTADSGVQRPSAPPAGNLRTPPPAPARAPQQGVSAPLSSTRSAGEAAAVTAQVAAPAAVPLLSELPRSFRSQVPDIDYSAHVYSENGGTGFVILNGSMRYQGHSLGGGLSVREILPDGVVLEYRGRSFRLESMKSWRQR